MASNAKRLQRLRYVQTAIKSRTGLGKTIVVPFYAPCADASEAIKYNFRAMPHEMTLIRNHKEYEYCYKQVLKMCYYV